MCRCCYYSLISLSLAHNAEHALRTAAQRGAMNPLSRKLQALFEKGRITPSLLEDRVKKALAREHLSSFVVTTIAGDDKPPTLHWEVDAAKRRESEKTRFGRRVLCTDRHNWSTGRIVHAFRSQWNVDALFRRAKKGGVVPWGPSHQWADGFGMNSRPLAVVIHGREAEVCLDALRK